MVTYIPSHPPQPLWLCFVAMDTCPGSQIFPRRCCHGQPFLSRDWLRQYRGSMDECWQHVTHKKCQQRVCESTWAGQCFTDTPGCTPSPSALPFTLHHLTLTRNTRPWHTCHNWLGLISLVRPSSRQSGMKIIVILTLMSTNWKVTLNMPPNHYIIF